MKKNPLLLLILVLTISLSIPLLTAQTQQVYAQPVSHTYTFTETVPGDHTNVEVNFTVTTDTGILLEGNIAVWILRINAKSSSTINNITINGESKGTKISLGLLLPLSDAFSSDTNMTPLPPLRNSFTLAKSENVLLFTGIAGLPAQISFNLSVTIEPSSGSPTTVYLASDVPTVSLILPNPGNAPPVINYYLILLYSMVFLVPISMILSNRWLRNRKMKKEVVGGGAV